MYKGYIDTIDYWLIPLYAIALLGVLWLIKKQKSSNTLYQQYLFNGFLFKLVLTLLYCFLIYYYWGFGDSINYFKNVRYMRELVDNGREGLSLLKQDHNYLLEQYDLEGSSNEAGWFLERITFLLSYPGLGRFATTSMLFALIAYSGMFKLLETLDDLMPERRTYLAWGVLFFPTVTLYGSGILKDTIGIAALGWLIYCNHQLIVKKRFKIRYWIIAALSVYLLLNIRAYILAVMAVPYLIFLIMQASTLIRQTWIRRAIFPACILLLIILWRFNAPLIEQYLGDYAVEKLFENVKEQQQSYLNDPEAGGSTFTIGEIDPTVNGFINKMPAGITATLYRPFLWESKNVLMIFSALENLLLFGLLLFVISRTGLFRSLKILFTEPYVLLCLLFCILFATLIGLSTSNFGTLGRYRIPIVPLYIGALMLIEYKGRIIVPKKPAENTA